MGIPESLFISFFCMSVVFALLGGLYVLTILSTDAIRYIEKNKAGK